MKEILTTEVEIFNLRKDAQWFELSVLDEDMNPVTFATSERIFQVKHLERKNVDLFIRKTDVQRAVYVCTRSRLKPNEVQSTGIQSRICSKFKD